MKLSLVSVFCLLVAGLSPAGNLIADHAHVHGGDSTHSHNDGIDGDSPLVEARRLQQHHEFAQAADILADVLEKEPLNTEAQLLHADVLLHDGRTRESQLACVRVAMSGAQTLAGYCAVQTLTAAGEHERAFAAAQALTPDDLPVTAQIWAFEIAADAAWKAGRLKAAEESFEKAMAFENVPHSTTDSYAAFLRATSPPCSEIMCSSARSSLNASKRRSP